MTSDDKRDLTSASAESTEASTAKDVHSDQTVSTATKQQQSSKTDSEATTDSVAVSAAKKEAESGTSKETKVDTLTPSQRFRIYNNNIKDGLQNGIQFTKYLDQLTETQDTDELLDSATHLFDFKMDTAFVTFPHQYTASDYYLLFMSRLLEIHEEKGLILTSAADHEELSVTFDALGTQPDFKFVLVGGRNGGAFFTDKASGLHLFYMNLERQQIRFNSKAFTDLFAVALADQPADKKMAAIDTLITFAKDLQRDYHFTADYNLLETDNNAEYQTKHPALPAGTVDKLFVASADSHYMLQNAPAGNGAIIDLEDDLVFGIADAGTQTAPKWVITTTDPKNQISLMAVLLNYDFIRQWYLANRDDLEIQSDPLIFA
ncbi:MAG: hypothetical protein LKG79_07280 [Furfurilactobacillus sp.]|jgi:hypothetical protein|uniref:Uncharacterized protein n=1 Tax=Furfurilactobacillus milii TaxID=2888272 RepID=A0ABT6D8B7_9LACO|nr:MULTISPECIES: hypothetical protein [Furfurilactobacillus]QLE66683.1 hypothetical protein LROSL2_1333 [Furfurilactobacillus rossiae]MCF6160568.1 hypothetical protein [Furfurilactobacillus milii]MCF6162800.1 hypothetical protein [Furfurilactobacillus milii]MCF6420280.1 hypothetical protein [Furfurilactobacillus milii]MCH4010549.1 hypothetical protein [Furfurilactobacillus sp.]